MLNFKHAITELVGERDKVLGPGTSHAATVRPDVVSDKVDRRGM